MAKKLKIRSEVGGLTPAEPCPPAVDQSLTTVFNHLQLSPAHRETIRALIALSAGRTVFPASLKDIASQCIGDNCHAKDPRSTVRYRLGSLERFQAEHGLELVARSQIGCRVQSPDGGMTYEKSRYEFKAMKELVKAIYGQDNPPMKQAVEKLLAITPVKRRIGSDTRVTSWKQRRKDVRTVATKSSKIIDNAIREGRNPYELIDPLVRDVYATCEQRVKEERDKKSIQDFMLAFESVLIVGDVMNVETPANIGVQIEGGGQFLSSNNYLPDQSEASLDHEKSYAQELNESEA